MHENRPLVGRLPGALALRVRPEFLLFMCDDCLRLGTPWLPELHSAKIRPRRRRVRRAVRTTPSAPQPRQKSSRRNRR